MKKILCAVLVLAMALSLAACGGKLTESLVADDGYYYFGSEVGREKLEASFNPLNPVNVYSNITFTEKMLYGDFELEDKEKNMEAFEKEAVLEDLEFSLTYSLETAVENLTTMKLSTLPVGLAAGPSSCNPYGRSLRGEHEWAYLYLLNEHGTTTEVLCTYTVSGNTVSFFPLDGFETVMNEDYQTEQILYTVGTDSIDYTFEIRGTSLKLTRDGKSVTLKCDEFANNDDRTSIHIGGYVAADSPAFENVDHFMGNLSKKLCDIYIETKDGELYSYGLNNACVAMNEEGQISFYWETKDENGNVTEHLKHFVYFPCDGYSMILADADQVYYYSESYTSRESVALGQGMTAEELEQLHSLSDDQIEQIAQKKADLLADLAKAYEEAGLNVNINTQTGEIALDATVLFGVNESEISEDGKTFLQQFTQIYTSVVYSEAYADFVSRVLVEGHTDTSGSYELNQALSQARADSVRDYCVSEACGVDSAYAAQFGQSLEAVGYAYDYPVYDADGQVDMDASRRVSFRFIISLTQGE